jgi:hypothetical protein
MRSGAAMSLWGWASAPGSCPSCNPDPGQSRSRVGHPRDRQRPNRRLARRKAQVSTRASRTAGAAAPGSALSTAVATPPVARSDDADLVRIELRRPFQDGTLAVDLDPLSLLSGLAAAIPPPRSHTVRYAGDARLRLQVARSARACTAASGRRSAPQPAAATTALRSACATEAPLVPPTRYPSFTS